MAVTSGRGVASGRAGGDITPVRNNNDVSQREDLANFISMITRDETPFMSSIGKTKATAIFHEWQTDSLEAPGDSTINEGTDYVIPGQTTGLGGGETQTGGGAAFNVVGPHRSRLGNYAQINGKTIAVSGTRRVIDQAGVADEYAYQLKKRGTELRRDLERDLVHTYQVASGSGNRKFGGYQSFINDASGLFHGSTASGTVVTNGARFATAATGSGASLAAVTATADLTGSGRGRYVPLDSAKQALSLTDIDQVMQRIYQEGGKATKIMVSPKLRRDFSDLLVSDGGVRRNIDEKGKLRQSVDIYMSDFGDLMIVPNYIMGLNFDVGDGATDDTGDHEAKDSVALIYDPMWFNVATLRPLQEVDVGQRGDSTIGMMVEECTLEVRNPVGCGAIYNLT